MTHDNAAGVTLGFFAGTIKGLGSITFAMLSWPIIGETALLALIGGILGWCGTELMRFLKKKIKDFYND
jgi:hypothetical protein